MRLSGRASHWSLLITLLGMRPAVSYPAIFGPDTRTYANEGSPSYSLARSTAVAVLSAFQDPTGPDTVSIRTDLLSSLVCQDEKFSGDPILSYSCSGFLVAPDLIVTAGHCMVNTGESRSEIDTYCPAYSWLFDYSMPLSGKLNLESMPLSSLYRCKQVVYAVKDESAPYRDYALVQLDRPVTDRPPLKLAKRDVTESDVLSMLGYPFGSPVKLSSGAKILLNNPARQSFVTNLNAFEGNSGSAVLNAAGEVVGILIAGTPTESFVPAQNGSCSHYNRCDRNGNDCQVPDADTSVFPGFQRVGSEVQRIEPVRALIEAFLAH